MAELIVTLKGREIQRFPITQKVISIGRGESCELNLSNESVSRDHARLSFVNRSFFIERVSSHNVVLLNGEECLHPMTIEDQGRLQIGKYTLILSKMTGPSLALIDSDGFSNMGSTEVLSTQDISRYAKSIDEPESTPRSLEQIRLDRVKSLERENILLKISLILSGLINLWFLNKLFG